MRRHTPAVVTFDCAHTLVDVNWSVDGFALDCAAHIGLALPDDAGPLYKAMYSERLEEYERLNAAKDHAAASAFWRSLTAEWLAALGLPALWASRMMAAAQELGYGPNSILFSLFDDVLPCLEALESAGVRMAVISNWDFTLHAVLDRFGLTNRFETVLASLEEGVEKPDPRLFEIALKRLGVRPEEALHVGDNPLDDYEGALGAGMRAVIVDRRAQRSSPPVIRTLLDLPEALSWIG